jgi:PST family polysaccharide transporter
MTFGGTVTLSNILGYLIQGADNVILGYSFGATGVGIYNRAQAILQKPLQQFTPSVMNVATSAFSRLAPDPERFERNAALLLSLTACLAGVVVTFVVGTADWLVALLLGPRWAAVVPILGALSLFAYVEPTASVIGALLIARGQPDRLVRWRLVSAPIVIASLAAGLSWGPLGVAASLALSGLLVRAPLFLWYAGRSLAIPFRTLLAAVAPYVVLGLAVAPSLVGLRRLWQPHQPVVGIAVYGLVGVGMYSALVLATRAGRSMVAEVWLALGPLRSPRAHESRPAAASFDRAVP